MARIINQHLTRNDSGNSLLALYDAWTIGGLNVRAYATNCSIYNVAYTAVPVTVTLDAAPTTTGYRRTDVVVLNKLSQIVIIKGTADLVGLEPSVDPNLYFKIRALLLTQNATTPVDPITETGTTATDYLFAEYGTVAGSESDVSFTDGSIAISTSTPLTGAKSIEATTIGTMDLISFDFGTVQSTVGFNYFQCKLKLKAAVLTDKTWILRLYNGAVLVGNFAFKHGEYGFNANSTALQYISIPLSATPFTDVDYTLATLFFYHKQTTISGYFLDDVCFLSTLPAIAPAVEVVAEPKTTNFLELIDTPSTYVGQAGKAAMVNPTETGLIFEDFTKSNIDGGSPDSVYLASQKVDGGFFTL